MSATLARDWFEAFHWGRRSESSFPIHRPSSAPANLTALGELVSLEVERSCGRAETVGPKGGRVWLASDAGSHRLWLVSEDGVTLPASLHNARITAVTYATVKGDTDANWRHPFDHPGPQLRRAADGEARIVRAGSEYFITERGIEG